MKLVHLLQEDSALPLEQLKQLALDRIQLSAEARSNQVRLLDEAGQFTTITNEVEANSLAESARNLQTYIRDVEEMGLDQRRVFSSITKRMKEIEDQHLGPLRQEKEKQERMVTDYSAAERRRVAAEEAARAAEIKRLEDERRLAEARAREEAARVAEENRRAEELARAKEATITTEKQMQAAIKAEENRKAEAEKRRLEAEALAEEARKRAEAAQAAICAPLPAAHKPVGMPTQRVMAYEVINEKALYAARPELCSLEAKPAAIRAVCVPRFPQSSDEVDMTSVPGLMLWWKDKTSTRAWR